MTGLCKLIRKWLVTGTVVHRLCQITQCIVGLLAGFLQHWCIIWSLMPDEGVTEGVSDLIPYEDKQWSNVREGANVFNYVQFTSVPCVAAIPIWVILLLHILELVQINIQCGYGSESKTQQAKEPNTYLFIFLAVFPFFLYGSIWGFWKHMFMTLANEGPDETPLGEATHKPLLQEGL